MSLVTLTTDFGASSPYAAAMKGAILHVSPTATIVDLSHQLPAQNVRHAAYFLAASLPYFPLGTLHVIVIDPEVGTDRALLYVEVAGQRLLVPDNGCWTLLPGASEIKQVTRLTEPRYWRTTVSMTFHGRDILAPVAGHLSLGLDPNQLGPLANDWVRLSEPLAKQRQNCIDGEIVFADDFGNLISNIPGDWLASAIAVRVDIGGHEARLVKTYGEAAAGELVALVSSMGRLEIAVVQASAAARLHKGVGTPISVVPSLAGSIRDD